MLEYFKIGYYYKKKKLSRNYYYHFRNFIHFQNKKYQLDNKFLNEVEFSSTHFFKFFRKIYFNYFLGKMKKILNIHMEFIQKTINWIFWKY